MGTLPSAAAACRGGEWMDGDIFLLEVAQGNPLSWDFREGKTGYRGPGKVFLPSPRRLRPSTPIRAAPRPQRIPAGGIPPAPQAWLRMGFDPGGESFALESTLDFPAASSPSSLFLVVRGALVGHRVLLSPSWG